MSGGGGVSEGRTGVCQRVCNRWEMLWAYFGQEVRSALRERDLGLESRWNCDEAARVLLDSGAEKVSSRREKSTGPESEPSPDNSRRLKKRLNLATKLPSPDQE